MRICTVSVQWPPIITGGGGVAVLNLVKELAKRHEVYVFTFGLDELPEEEEFIVGENALVRVKRVFVEGAKNLKNPFEGTKKEEIERLMKFIESVAMVIPCELCDVIHLHGHFAVPALARILKERGCKSGIVTTFHAFESLIELEKKRSDPEIFNIIAELERDALRYSDISTVASTALLKRLFQIHGAEYLDKVRIVHLGIDNELFVVSKPKERVEALHKKLAGDGYLILNLNRIDPSKGIEYAIESLKYLDNKYTLVVAGKFEERNKEYLEYLQEKAKETKRKILFMKNISEDLKICLYDAADIFVMPSPTEPFGLTILESLARKTPVIVPDVEGPREIFGVDKDFEEEYIDIWGGIMVNYRDPNRRAERLAKSIKHMTENYSVYKEKATKAREIIKEKYSWEAIARIFEGLYKELTQK